MVLLTFFCLSIVQLSLSTAEDPIIELPSGLIRGRQDVTAQNTIYYLFEKIPYAAPPVGQLRFKAPQAPERWEGILNATGRDVTCVQDIHFGPPPRQVADVQTQSEDCLFVNVYTPNLPSDHNKELLPVMFFIHGGGFILGSGMEYPSEALVDSGVVYVNINYRLGVLGFLSTQDEVIPGNNALKDQLFALKWTHDNIHLFGGDPEKITIFGQSAGSVSVAYQLLSQQSQGLYRGAILQSGSSLMPGAYQRKSRKIAFGMAALLNETFADSDDSQALLEYLQTVDAITLRDAGTEYKDAHLTPETEEMFQGSFWAPVIEPENPEALITQKMYSLLQTGNVVKVPIMIGICSEEVLSLYPNDEEFLTTHLAAYDEHLDWLPSNDMHVTDQAELNEIGRRIREIYTKGDSFLDHFGAGIRFYSDNTFTRSSIKFAELYSQWAPTYFYQFSYDGELGGGNYVPYGDGAETVGHAEELFYIFCMQGACNYQNASEDDQLMSQRLLKLWTDFAKYLNPTPTPSDLLQNISWPVVDADYPYLNINSTLEIRYRPKNETYSQWVEIYSALSDQDFDAY